MTLALRLGERLHNPLNLEGAFIPWRGKTGMHGNYVVYATDEDGARAGAVDLLEKRYRDGLVSFSEIVPKFAPADDGNDVAAYIDDLVSDTGFAADLPLELEDIGKLYRVLRAFIKHEQGRVIYPPSLLMQACAEALHHVFPNEPGEPST